MATKLCVTLCDVCYVCNAFREEPKQDSDLSDPWIMTVKGNHHSVKSPIEDVTVNHKVSHKVQNGSGPMIAKSPPKDSNLNHYRPEKATPVSLINNYCIRQLIILHAVSCSHPDHHLKFKQHQITGKKERRIAIET